jgi:hypothetical protein
MPDYGTEQQPAHITQVTAVGHARCVGQGQQPSLRRVQPTDTAGRRHRRKNGTATETASPEAGLDSDLFIRPSRHGQELPV